MHIFSKNRKTWFLTVSCLLMVNFSSRLYAQGYRATGFADLDVSSMVSLDTDIIIHDVYTGILPNLSLQHAMNNTALGFDIGFVMGIPEKGDNQTRLMPFVFNFKSKSCIQGNTRICYGLDTDLGIDPFDADLDEFGAFMVGAVSNMMRMSRVGYESLGIDPLFVVELKHSSVFGQVSVGPSIYLPLTEDRDAEANLLFEFEIGAILEEKFAFGAGLRGVSFLTTDDSDSWLVPDSWFAFDFNLQLLMQDFRSFVRLRVPLEGGYYEELMDLSFMVGISHNY